MAVGAAGLAGADHPGLVQLAGKIVDKGLPEDFDITYGAFRDEVRRPVRHPHDDMVWIGGAAALSNLPKSIDLPAGVDAVVSLCRVADGHLRAGVKHLDVRLIDQEGQNANLDFVLVDTVRAVEQLRAEGRTVLIHGVQAYSRTPTIGAAGRQLKR